MSLNLDSLGLELERVRRARRASLSGVSSESSVSASTSPGVSTHQSPDIQAAPLGGSALDTLEEKPYPLCLLCFSRAPSAVLLPCCHLNLCYLCAPLLMHKDRQARAAAFPDHAQPTDAPPRTDRVPFNVALSRAVANHPKSRRFSMGGYVAPAEGIKGGELRGADLVGSRGGEGGGTMGTGVAGLTTTVEEGGQVRLGMDGEHAATCLVCRQGVSGWLRVYAG